MHRTEADRRQAYAAALTARTNELIAMLPEDIRSENALYDALAEYEEPWKLAEREYVNGIGTKAALNEAATTCLLRVRAVVEIRGFDVPDGFPAPTAERPTPAPAPPDPVWMRDGAWNDHPEAELDPMFEHVPHGGPPADWGDVPPPDEEF